MDAKEVKTGEVEELLADANTEDTGEEQVSSPETPEGAVNEVDEAVDAANAEGDTDSEPDWKDKYVRLHADWDNYRKRMDVERADERIRATERLMSDILPVLDDFSRTIDYAEKNGEGNLLEGVKAVSAKLDSALTKHGLVTIDPVGDAFDALTCQAVGTVEDSEAFDETVKEVYQKGYSLGRKVIRPAMVTITTGGEKRPSEPSEKREGADENGDE